MTYYPNESVGLAHPVGAEGLTFQCGDSAACHAEPPTCGCPETLAHTCGAAEFDHTPAAQRAANCPRCKYLTDREDR